MDSPILHPNLFDIPATIGPDMKQTPTSKLPTQATVDLKNRTNSLQGSFNLRPK